jgi:hypothetical protein
VPNFLPLLHYFQLLKKNYFLIVSFDRALLVACLEQNVPNQLNSINCKSVLRCNLRLTAEPTELFSLDRLPGNLRGGTTGAMSKGLAAVLKPSISSNERLYVVCAILVGPGSAELN